MQRLDFNYHLPTELIAQYPTRERTASRLLVLNKSTGTIAHRQFTDLPDYLNPGDLIVFNDSRVLPARLSGTKKSGGKIEILIERVLDKQHALAHIRASHAPKSGAIIALANDHSATVQARERNLYKLFFPSTANVVTLLYQIGHIPLPPYIKRPDEAIDTKRYQTVYSRVDGSVAAPTAGLHYDDALLQRLRHKQVQLGFVTLHVGAGTFQPVRVNDISQHKMHSEYMNLGSTLCAQIKATKAAGKRVLSVGTTSARCLESAAQAGGLEPYQGETNLFIYPGYQFKCIDALQTNFHLPESTLLMLVAALAGYENTQRAYQTAMQEHYRFFSYGDAMLVLL